VVGLGLAAAVGAAAQQRHFATRLSVVPIDFRTQAVTTGSGSVDADLDGNRLTLRGSFDGLQGAATAARLHEGLATGVRGPAIYELTVTNATQGDIRGSLELTTRQVEALRAGRLYVQVHSESAPEGNLWGWLLE
jgi:hypothetical protein